MDDEKHGILAILPANPDPLIDAADFREQLFIDARCRSSRSLSNHRMSIPRKPAPPRRDDDESEHAEDEPLRDLPNVRIVDVS